MKSALFLGLLGVLSYSPCGESKKEIPVANETKQATTVQTNASTPIDFQKQIQPILEIRCNPCHFPGGKMYERLPFDKAETLLKPEVQPVMIKRIKEEDENKLIREYFEQTKK